MAEDKPQRLFVALWPGPEVRNELRKIQTQLNLSELGRAVPIENLHLTLLFLGNVPKVEVQAIERLVEQVEFTPFAMQIDRVGFWPHNNIVWAGQNKVSAPLESLASQVRRTMRKYVIERRKFTPHITLARKVRRRVHYEPNPIRWNIRNLCLVHSVLGKDGAHYRQIAHSKSYD